MIEMLKLTSIRIDGDTQLRLETNQDVVQSYAQDMRDGDVFPPVVVFHDGVNFWLSDGFHRFFATQEAGKGEIAADIRRGARRDALLHSVEANRKHGLALTNNDKRRIVTLLLNDVEWSKWSDREIARRCGVSHPFVGSLRSSLESVTSERVYTTKYGTLATMDVTRIGANNLYDGLSAYSIKELEERGVTQKDIAEIAEYARSVKSDTKHNAGWALLIGCWMLGCKEGDKPKIGDSPYTREQLEKEGWELWCLLPRDIDTFLEIGELQRKLHAIEVGKGKDFFDVTDDDMLSNCTDTQIATLAVRYEMVRFRTCYTIWQYHTWGLSQEAKEKLLNGEFTDLKDAYQYDRDQSAQRWKEIALARSRGSDSTATAVQA